MKFLVWGAGADGVKLSRLYLLYNKIYNDDITGVIDGDSSKWGEVLFGQKIMGPENIHRIGWDRILIASTLYYSEIKRRLVEDYNIHPFDIISLSAYCNHKVISYQYKNNLERNAKRGRCDTYRPFNKKSLVVYTAIIGDYDTLKPPKIIEPDVRYVCYTDQKSVHSDIWEVRYIEEVLEHERAVAVRKYKMLPHRFFPEFEASIWVDASLIIRGRLSELLDKYQTYANFLLMPHNERICAYEEAFANVVGLLAQKSVVMQQVARYMHDDYPVDNGLMLGGFLARNHHDIKIIHAMENWFNEVSTYSCRDQISLPYALWKNDVLYDLCDLSIFDNPWMLRMGHKHIRNARGADKYVSIRAS